MNIIQFTAALHDELNLLILPTCTSPLQQIGVNLALTAMDYRIGELAAAHAEEASALGLIDKNGEVNLAAAEYTILNGFKWPHMFGLFKFDKADAEKIMAAIRKQAEALEPPQLEQTK